MVRDPSGKVEQTGAQLAGTPSPHHPERTVMGPPQDWGQVESKGPPYISLETSLLLDFSTLLLLILCVPPSPGHGLLDG